MIGFLTSLLLLLLLLVLLLLLLLMDCQRALIRTLDGNLWLSAGTCTTFERVAGWLALRDDKLIGWAFPGRRLAAAASRLYHMSERLAPNSELALVSSGSSLLFRASLMGANNEPCD